MKKGLLLNMLRELPFSKEELASLIATAPYRYKVYQIPKRKPNEYRTIAQPSKEVKLLQRWLIEKVFIRLPIHKAATAYREGISIAKHADIHAKGRFLLKMDFKDFFPSILVKDVEKHLTKYGKLSAEEVRMVSHAVCWRDRAAGKLCVSIGAPSSPILSNAVLVEFDRQVARVAREKKVLYSRYADDLAFSTNRKGTLSEMAAEVERICSTLEYPRLRINHEKTVFTSRRFRRVLVGLVLTPEGEISLGREKKRRLRSELYRFSQGSLDKAHISKLRGELAFAWSVEKSFILSLIRQRGVQIFQELGLPFTDN